MLGRDPHLERRAECNTGSGTTRRSVEWQPGTFDRLLPHIR
jgi:hypothetical protein